MTCADEVERLRITLFPFSSVHLQRRRPSDADDALAEGEAMKDDAEDIVRALAESNPYTLPVHLVGAYCHHCHQHKDKGHPLDCLWFRARIWVEANGGGEGTR